jgi:cytochrome bd-type quinol oxidase subunit 2
VGSALTGPPSAQTLPFFGWDRHTGDWRVPHFIGLHAMQVMPGLAWLQQRTGGHASEWTIALRVGTAAYLAVFVGVVVWTACGRSVLDASAGAVALVGLPLAVLLAVAARLVRRHIA